MTDLLASAENECDICGNRPDAEGRLEHGKGCYAVSEDGGGVEYFEPADKLASAENKLAVEQQERIDQLEREVEQLKRTEKFLRYYQIPDDAIAGLTKKLEAETEDYPQLHGIVDDAIMNLDQLRKQRDEVTADRDRLRIEVDTRCEIHRQLAESMSAVKIDRDRLLATIAGLESAHESRDLDDERRMKGDPTYSEARLACELADVKTERDRLLARQGELERDLERWIETSANFLQAGATAEAERDALLTRRDELLATIARISQSTPLDSEVAEALEQRGKLLAEIGTLKAHLHEAERALHMEDGKDHGQVWAKLAVHDAMEEEWRRFKPVFEAAKAWHASVWNGESTDPEEQFAAGAALSDAIDSALSSPTLSIEPERKK